MQDDVKEQPWWAKRHVIGSLAKGIMDSKGEWVRDDYGKWVFVTKKGDILGGKGGISGAPTGHPPTHYVTPSYLKPKPIPPTPAPAIIKPPEDEKSPKMGSIAPTIRPLTNESPKSNEIPLIQTCPLCNGHIKEGECENCSGRLCPGCGEINFALARNCQQCGLSLFNRI